MNQNQHIIIFVKICGGMRRNATEHRHDLYCTFAKLVEHILSPDLVNSIRFSISRLIVDMAV